MNGTQEVKGTQNTEREYGMKGLRKIASVFGLAAGLALVAPQAMAAAHRGPLKSHAAIQRTSAKRSPMKKASMKKISGKKTTARKISSRKTPAQKVSKLASGPVAGIGAGAPVRKIRVSRKKISNHLPKKAQASRKVAKKKVSAHPRNKKKSLEPTILESFEQS
jgi:hypothetical protein